MSHLLLCVCRGKLLNVRDASTTQISGNAEIQNIKQIMGLQHGKVDFCSIVASFACSCWMSTPWVSIAFKLLLSSVKMTQGLHHT